MWIFRSYVKNMVFFRVFQSFTLSFHAEENTDTHYFIRNSGQKDHYDEKFLNFQSKNGTMCFVLAPDNVCDPIIGLVIAFLGFSERYLGF